MTNTFDHQPDGPPVADARESGTGVRGFARLAALPAWVPITCVLVVLVALWELVTALGWVDPIVVSTPQAVASAIPRVLQSDEGQSALLTTGYEIVVAFVIATVIGFVVGTALGISETLRRAYLPVLTFILGTPKVIFLPIFMTFFGIGEQLSIVFGAFEAFFYIAVNVEGGVESIDRRHLRAAHAFKATRRQTVTNVILPSALPGISSGLWFGIKHSFLGVLVAELFASQKGVGALVKQFEESLNTDSVLALILIISVIAIVAGIVWSRIEDHLSRWRTTDAAATTIPKAG